jgi:two-component system, cell cycle sensor histidine kinase and response regulator CckA
VVAVAIFVYDLTERRGLEAQLLQAQKMEAIGTLAGGVAHDFNNILMAIMGYANILQMRMVENDPLRVYVDQIASSTGKAANLTQSLLAFSRKQTMELHPRSTNMIVRDVEKLLKRLVPEDVKFTVSLNEDVTIMADVTQIDQVLMNLISNAKDAMPKGGALHVEVKPVEIGKVFRQTYGFGEPGRYSMISVTDTGSGMDEATQKRIFEPFFTTKEAGKGTGLGLSIAYGIVKQHNGYITVSSQLGEGTTFEIYLPAVDTPASELGQASEKAPGGTETVLVAEDNNDVRGIVVTILRVAGYTVMEASDGEDAVRRYKDQREKINLLILDVVMPGKNGKEVYEEIHALDPSIPALFMSGYTGDVVLDKGLQDTTVNYISKPLKANELLIKVREVLER